MHVDAILGVKGREVRTIGPDVTVEEAMQTLHRSRISSLVVSRDGREIQGIISDRGIMNLIAERGVGVMSEPVERVMTREVITCSLQDDLSAIMGTMTNRRIRHIPVVKDGQLCGLISIGDVVKYRIDEIQTEADAMREYISGGR
ncbi:MAG TPA: CBS domain-containing protein [Geminicoccus sp.]|uniref:CBS domain-containing protein n=1 Tax=Geminicoccus sp. TaxID=2024832 RepID=UPI002E37EDE8|nr:CBS domain-containing protein [Geminicoccus sp.]HEX2528006.1 CBS domain-containing protein [Geminicoccus sp.]